MKQLFKRVFILSFLLISLHAVAQKSTNDINVQNLSTVKVDDLSDEQIAKFWQQAQEKGLSIIQLQQVAIQRNMSSVEFNKLKMRIENLPLQPSSKTEKPTTDTQRKYDDKQQLQNPTEKEKVESKIFGAELFSNKTLTFEPDLKMATPQNYQLGPDDELLLDISGSAEASYALKVSPEGKIRIPSVGPVNVGGLTIEQARKKIIRQLSSSYSTIATGETSVSIALGNIRSIKVTIMGEVELPGTYTLPSLATAFNALYVSGGPNKNGSFRNIKIYRSGKEFATIDVYAFLLKGDAKGNVRLQDQDVIKVGSYDVRVELKGEVKREGFYEVINKETLKDVIGFAGGFTTEAYKDRIKVFRNNSKEMSVADVPEEMISMFIPQTGDIFTIDKVLERFSNRVQINGAVFRPGYFALDEGMTLSKLIVKADGLKEDAFTSRGLIYRLKDDNSLEAISFDLKEVMAGKDIVLKREDIVQILSKLELREEYTVQIAGQVINPGIYPYAENLKVEDLIITSGGLKESAAKNKIEIARRIKNINVGDPNAAISTVISYQVNDSLQTADGNEIVLLPFDVVSIYTLPGYESQRNIVLEGEVFHPGQYTMVKSNEHISEIIKRAGGLTASAFPDGAVLLRTRKLSTIDQYISKKKILSLEKQSTDTTRSNEIAESDVGENKSIVGIDLVKIMKYPGSKYDLIVEDDDIINVPRKIQTVRVSGEVLYPVRIQYEKGKRFNSYVDGAGGYTLRGLRKKGYIVYANGSAESTHKLLFVFNIHPKIKPGSEIIIPTREDKRKISPIEIAGITSSFATILLVFYTITKK